MRTAQKVILHYCQSKHLTPFPPFHSMSKRPVLPGSRVAGDRDRQAHSAKRFKHAGGAASFGGLLRAAPPVSNDTVYDALKKAAAESAYAFLIWTLHHGTEAQVDDLIHSFFRTEEGKDHSLVFARGGLDADILEEMKTAMETLRVPKGRCFWENEELDDECDSGDEVDIGDYWSQADGLKESVARLAWLMQNKEE